MDRGRHSRRACAAPHTLTHTPVSEAVLVLKDDFLFVRQSVSHQMHFNVATYGRCDLTCADFYVAHVGS